MSAVIIKCIDDTGPDLKARRVTFVDGESRVTSAAAVRRSGVSPGTEFDSRSFDRIESECARERALRLLAVRDRSGQELVQRLRRDGYPCDVADGVIERLRESDLISDERFAMSWVSWRVSAGYGCARIRRELRHKGVDEEIIDQAIAETTVDVSLSAARALGSRVAYSDRQRVGLERRLRTRGFDASTARAEAAKRMVGDS